MRDHGLKEDAAARAIGINQATLNRIINPDSSRKIRNPKLETLSKIAAALGATTHDVVHRDLSASPAAGSSQPGGLDHRKLAIALVAVEKAIRAIGLDPQNSWGRLAKLVIWAMDLQDETYPDGVVTKADQRGFDALVELELRARGNYAVGEAGQDADGSDGRGEKAPSSGKADRDR